MRRILILLIIPFFVACGNKTLIDETHTFDNDCWLRFEPETYKFDVADTERSHAVCVTLHYDTSRVMLDNLPLVVDFFADSNELHNITASIRIRDIKGNRRGETIGQYCIVSDTIDHHRTFNRKGQFTYRIKQGTSKYELYGVTSLNFKVTESKY